jgi:peptidoglycan hydrolase CwlO-like protein
MRITYAVVTIILIGLLGVSALAEDNNDQYANPPNVSIKPGLEAQEVSPGVTVVVPQGAQISRVNNSLSVLESSEEYAARNFVDVDGRLDEMEKSLNELKKELYFIKKELHKLSKGGVVSAKR